MCGVHVCSMHVCALSVFCVWYACVLCVCCVWCGVRVLSVCRQWGPMRVLCMCGTMSFLSARVCSGCVCALCGVCVRTRHRYACVCVVRVTGEVSVGYACLRTMHYVCNVCSVYVVRVVMCAGCVICVLRL